MAEGNESDLPDQEIERQRSESEDEHARAKREEIGLRAETRGEREQREPREEENRGRLAARGHRLTGKRPEGRWKSTAAIRM